MSNRGYFRSARALALGAALCAAILASAAPSRAQGDEGRGYRRGDRPERAPSERVQGAPAPSGGGEKWRRSEGERRGDDERGRERRGDEYRGGERRGGGSYEGGGEKWRRGDDDRRGQGRTGGGAYPGGDRKWRRGEVEHRAPGHRGYDGGRHWGGRDRDRHWHDGGWCYHPSPRYWHRPQRVIRFSIGLPYYYPHYSYRRYVVRRPVVREYVPNIEVENYPPAGCYYWDPYCEREWENLDEYSEHLDGADHGNTLEIVDESSGEWVRTLVFRDGYWSVRR